MESKYIFVMRGFYWDWWWDVDRNLIKFPQGHNPNNHERNLPKVHR